MTKKEIAEILKKCRISAGYTQKEAAEKIGRPQQTLGSWETGKSQPDANTLFELCDLYGVSIDDAFGYTQKLGRQDFSPAEHEIIKKYRALDERGKAAVDATLDREYAESMRLKAIIADAVHTTHAIADAAQPEKHRTGAEK